MAATSETTACMLLAAQADTVPADPASGAVANAFENKAKGATFTSTGVFIHGLSWNPPSN